MKALGIMQGRLLPKYKGNYQAFPADTWQKEFLLAEELGLDCIEFILDFASASVNPLLSEKGIAEIKALTQKTNVKVFTICADYFMSSPLFDVDKARRDQSLEVLKTLLHNAKLLGVTDIVIPFVDESSMIKNFSQISVLKETLAQAIFLSESLAINLSLETDLAPGQFLELLHFLNSKCIKVNYDTGNSASWGYDVRKEMAAYGSYVSTVHIKDRKRFGGSVVLGTGDADIGLAMDEFKKQNFQNCFIMQAFRDDEGVEIFKKQLNWFKPLFEKYYEKDRSFSH